MGKLNRIFLYHILFSTLCAITQGQAENINSTPQNPMVPSGYVDGNLCNRDCNGTKLNCFFNFQLETFYTMGKPCFDCPTVLSDCWRPDCIVGGGIQRKVTVINRQMPGPSIEICQGDKVMVLLQNHEITGEGTTLHWHGQHLKRNPYMDGVPMVTQCPIQKDNNFTYVFYADEAGTYWWHSHMEMQRGEGLYGALIVRVPPFKNFHADLYDFDLSSHVLQVGDWNNISRADVFEAYIMTTSLTAPTGILINGLGFQSTTNLTRTPLADFRVVSGKRYRFRLINVGFADCPLEISIDGHKLLVISLDGNDIEPIEVDSFVSASGERFDFILNANQSVSTYYIRVKGYIACEFYRVYTVGNLVYEGSSVTLLTESFPGYENAAPSRGVILNPVTTKTPTNYSKFITIDQARDNQPSGDLNAKHVKRFYISLSMSIVNNPSYNKPPYYGIDQVSVSHLKSASPQFNHITYKNLESPLLPARFTINSKEFCNEETMRDKDCMNHFCECPHVLEVPENAIVEFVFLDLTYNLLARQFHPIHLHGYYFNVLGSGEFERNVTKEELIQMDRVGLLNRNFKNPPRKDTVGVPKRGYTIVRFKADNIGYWFMHCHNGYHGSQGMNLVIKVGENKDMPPVPKQFPTCGNWPSAEASNSLTIQYNLTLLILVVTLITFTHARQT